MSQKQKLLVVVLAVLCVVGAVLAINATSLQHWLSVHTGTVNESGVYYGFWSGFGADLGEVTLVTTVGLGVYTGVRKTNCHVKGCWRIGHHNLEGTPYHLCARHHPDVPEGGATHAEILEHGRIAHSLHHRLHGSTPSDEPTGAGTPSSPDAPAPSA